MTSSSLSKRVAALPQDGGAPTLEKVRSEERDDLLLRRIAELESEAERATASLRTQGAMLRGGVQDHAAKLARAREVQALTAAEFTARLGAMENELARLARELDLAKQTRVEVPTWVKPLRRVGGAVWRRVSKWVPGRSERAEDCAPPPSAHVTTPDEATVRLLLKALPSQVAAWKALLGKRR